MTVFNNFYEVLFDVALALSPLLVAFIVFQVLILKVSAKEVKRILIGFALTFLGLSLFLQGVKTGYMPLGYLIGERLAGLKFKWLLIPIGLILGFCSTMAEPTIRVLIDEVEKLSNGHINRKLMLYSLCIGVAIAVALSMVRVLTGIALLWFIVPLYLTAFIFSRFTGKEFVGIAFDAGCVVTGPMTVTFVLSLIVGAASNISGRSVMMDGFGMVSLVAIMPILTILLLGFLYKIKGVSNEK